MLAKFDTLELAHLHFIPKVHMVRLETGTTSVSYIFCFIVAKYTTTTDHCFHPCTSHAFFPISRQAPSAHIFESCSKDACYQWTWSDSRIRKCASAGLHLRCGWSLHDDTTARCLRSNDAILSKTFTSWPDWYPIDQRYHANGSSGVRHQLLCLQGQVLSTDSRWGDGIGIYDGLSEHLHVRMEIVLDRTSTGMWWTLWPVCTTFSLWIWFSVSSISDRYIDDGFMTTNLTFDQIKAKLDTADQKDRNIRIKYQIQSCVDFLDVVIQNDHGQLTSSVFHKPTVEPYILPYTSDHPHHVRRNIPYAALLRAARICSNVHDFTIERIWIDMSLLLNDYPSAFIAKHTSRFFD